MQTIDTITVMVDNFGDLSSVLTANSEITYVYLGSDILMTSGIQLHNNRSLVVLDGEYPPGSGIIHSLTDANSEYGMIYKNNVSNLDITFQNMTINGRNFYGMPRIVDGNTNVTITYRKVTYTGPQMTWHFAGITRYIDCNITILRTGTSAVNELAEACRVEIGGKTTIQHTGSGFAVFYFYKSNASLTILEDAQVEISTTYDFLYHEYPPSFTIQPRASFTLTTQRGFSRNVSHRLGSLLVDQDASFRYIQNSNSEGLAALYIDGPFTVNKNARVYMQADFTTGDGNNRLVQFTANSSTRGLYLNNPKSFVLYTRGPGTDIYFSGLTPFSFTTKQVNFWSDATPFPVAGTFDDSPLHSWHNPDWSQFNIEGRAITSTTTINSSTLAAPITPPLSNLKLYQARVLSIGDLPLIVEPALNDGKPITGTTDPYAKIRITYTNESGTRIFAGTADENGSFAILTTLPVPLGTTVSVSANVPFLYITMPVQDAGELYIASAPTRIRFIVPAISSAPLIILGRGSNDPVVVVDTRFFSTPWELTVNIDGPMFCEASGRILPGSVVFVPDGGTLEEREALNPGVSKRLYTGGPNVTSTPVTWSNNTGLLLNLTGPLYIGEEYIAHIEWNANPVDP